MNALTTPTSRPRHGVEISGPSEGLSFSLICSPRGEKTTFSAPHQLTPRSHPPPIRPQRTRKLSPCSQQKRKPACNPLRQRHVPPISGLRQAPSPPEVPGRDDPQQHAEHLYTGRSEQPGQPWRNHPTLNDTATRARHRMQKTCELEPTPHIRVNTELPSSTRLVCKRKGPRAFPRARGLRAIALTSPFPEGLAERQRWYGSDSHVS